MIERHCYYRIGHLPDVIMNKNKDLRDIEAMHVESIPKLEVRAPFNFDTLVLVHFAKVVPDFRLLQEKVNAQ